MTRQNFKIVVGLLGSTFTMLFMIVVVPPLIRAPDIIGAFAAGFVNPYASGYAIDTITCWCILTSWIIYEARTKGIRHGWVAVLLGVVPGVATGFALYLLLRLKHEQGTQRA